VNAFTKAAGILLAGRARQRIPRTRKAIKEEEKRPIAGLLDSVIRFPQGPNKYWLIHRGLQPGRLVPPRRGPPASANER